MKTTLRNAGIGLVCLASLAASPGAFAGVSKVICVPWQGDVTKQHTAITPGGCPDATGIIPASVNFEVIASCYGGVVLKFQLNGNVVGSMTTSAGHCTCTPPVDSVSISAADLAAYWNPSGNNTLRALLVSGSEYFAIVRAKVNYGGNLPTRTICIYNYSGGDCDLDNLCDAGYTGLSSLDESVTFGNTWCPTGTPLAMLIGVIKTTSSDAIYYKWVYGDGGESAISTLSGSTKYNVEVSHQYAGAVGTPFTAQLVVADNSALAGAMTDNYLVKLENNTLDARINVAIDAGLWYLYKQGTIGPGSGYTTSDGSPCVVWGYSSYFASPTASAVQAFEINGSKETGNFDQDPYAEYVHLGLNWLLKGSCYGYPMLQAAGIGVQNGNSTDANGNGIGVETRDYGYAPIYQGGMVMDAIIASGTPGASSGREFVSGHVATYRDIVQDMCDMYAYGQYDGAQSFSTDSGSSSGIIGGWRYNWQDWPDNSACQWAAIGMIPAQEGLWSCTVPAWVKTYDDNWLWYSHYKWNGSPPIWGGFGYTGASYGDALTPSGMVQLSFAGNTTSDPRWVRSERWLADNWSTWRNSGNVYAYYAFAKAMRLAKPTAVVNFASSGLDWYRGSGSTDGLAKQVSDYLIAHGSWDYYGANLGTAWGVIILRPTLFAAAPVACFTAHPNPSFSDLPITFDPTCSGHSEPGKGLANLTKFEWDWNNDGVFDQTTTTPVAVSHSFHCASLPCTFPVTLRVTDDATPPLTATFVMDIHITDPPHPPVSKPGGPYLVSLCAGDALTLDGSASFDPDEGLHQAGCNTCPNDIITAWNWDLDGAPFTYAGPSGKIVELGSGFTTYFPSAGSYDIGLKVADNTALAYPASGQPNLTDQAFAQVLVYKAGFCELDGTPGCQQVTLQWASFGATIYRVYQSYTGPNSGFSEVTTTVGATATVAANENQDAWYRVLAEKNGELYLTLARKLTATPATCQCITGFKASPKAGKVQLDWTPYAGAACYDVYRSTVSPVSLVAGNRIKTCYMNPYVTFVDTAVVNGTTYYYKVVVKDATGKDVCRSAEVSAKPALPRR